MGRGASRQRRAGRACGGRAKLQEGPAVLPEPWGLPERSSKLSPPHAIGGRWGLSTLGLLHRSQGRGI